GADTQDALTLRNCTHSFGSVHHNVQDDLLQLTTMAKHHREPCGQLKLQHNPASMQLAVQQCDGLADDVVDDEQSLLLATLLEDRSDRLDRLAGTMAIA